MRSEFAALQARRDWDRDLPALPVALPSVPRSQIVASAFFRLPFAPDRELPPEERARLVALLSSRTERSPVLLTTEGNPEHASTLWIEVGPHWVRVADGPVLPGLELSEGRAQLARVLRHVAEQLRLLEDETGVALWQGRILLSVDSATRSETLAVLLRLLAEGGFVRPFLLVRGPGGPPSQQLMYPDSPEVAGSPVRAGLTVGELAAAWSRESSQASTYVPSLLALEGPFIDGPPASGVLHASQPQPQLPGSSLPVAIPVLALRLRQP